MNYEILQRTATSPVQDIEWIILWNKLFYIAIGIVDNCHAVN
jgi:hypothetical protein